MFDRYKVKSGESLDMIAHRFNTDTNVLREINQIPLSFEIRQDMEILVPKGKSKYFDIYTIKEGDTLYQISLRYNVNPELIAAINGLNLEDYIYPRQEILIPKVDYSYYITTEGDTLDIVTNRFKTSTESIINNNETIYLLPGQLLVNKRQK